jgi:hypothetical protein
LGEQVGDQVGEQVGDQVGEQVGDQVGEQVSEQLNKRSNSILFYKNRFNIHFNNKAFFITICSLKNITLVRVFMNNLYLKFYQIWTPSTYINGVPSS